MSKRTQATSEDIREGIAQGFIKVALNHPYHGDETVQSAIVFAVKQWLNENKTDVLEAIACAVAKSE
jgi:hypothetical protein